MNPSETSKNLLSRLRSGELTLPQFLTECGYWALNYGFDELRPKPLPTRPLDLREYDNMDFKSRLKISSEFWWQPIVREYLDQKVMILHHNKGVYDWLKEIKTYIPQEDYVSQNKIDERLKEFDNTKEEYNTHFRLNEVSLSTEQRQVKEMFGGEIV